MERWEPRDWTCGIGGHSMPDGAGGASRPVRPTIAHLAKNSSRRGLRRGAGVPQWENIGGTWGAGGWLPCEQVGVR